MFLKNQNFIKANPNFNISKSICSIKNFYSVVNSKQNTKTLVWHNNNQNISIHSRFNPELEATKIASSFNQTAQTAIVFGYGFGYYVNELAKKFKKVIVIEPDKKLFNLALQHFDFTNFLANISYIIGYNYLQVLPLLPKTNYCILNNLPTAKPNSLYFEKLNTLLTKKPNSKQMYKLFSSQKPKIAFLVDGHVLANESLYALQQLNCTVEIIDLQKINLPIDEFLSKIQSFINNFKPDFFLNINHFGFDKYGSLAGLLNENEIPYVSWFVDSPTILLDNSYNLNNDFFNIFVWDRSYLKPLNNAGFSKVDFLPLATSSHLFFDLNLDCKRNLAFVGSSLTNAIHKNIKSFMHKPQLFNLLEESAQKLLQLKTNIPKNCYDFDNFDTKEQKLDFEAALLWRAAQIKRLNALNCLAKFNPDIYGDSNWQNILSNCFNLNKELNYNTELNSFYNSTYINFNVTSCQMLDAVNQRVFDCAAGANFSINDEMPQLLEFFEKDEIVFYSEVNEIQELVKFYLNNTDVAKKIAQKTRLKVINNHTYVHRYKKLINILKQRYV